MARYKTILAYDGTHFVGSQRQKDKSRTVQGEFEKALRKIGWRGKSVLLAGRTDSGVHAEGQVAAFDMDWRHSEEQALHALNAELPPDIAVKSLREADADFHPRFDAISREYRYSMFCEPIRDPLRERYAWRVWPPFDEEALQQTADLFIGAHDFSSFGSPTTPKGTTIRTATKAEWRKMPKNGIQFEVRADAFLYRMVRRLVFVQMSVARGKRSGEEVQSALSKQTKLPAGLAPAHGLTLVEVRYESN